MQEEASYKVTHAVPVPDELLRCADERRVALVLTHRQSARQRQGGDRKSGRRTPRARPRPGHAPFRRLRRLRGRARRPGETMTAVARFLAAYAPNVRG